MAVSLQVTSLGSAVPRAGAGHIRAVSKHAVNIAWGDLIVSLVRSQAAMTVLGATCPVLWPAQPAPGVRPSLSRLAGGTCRFATHAIVLRRGGLRLSLALPSAASFDGRLQRIDANALRGSAGTQALRLARDELARSGRDVGLLAVIAPAAAVSPLLRAAVSWLRQASGLAPAPGSGTWQAQRARLTELVGLGVGLTPSGDDFITGALAAEAAVSRLQPAGDDPLRAALGARLSTTSAPGRSLLWAALGGRFPAYLQQLVAVLGAVCRGGAQPHALRAAVRRAVGHGHTSGSDTLAGLLWRLDASRAARAIAALARAA